VPHAPDIEADVVVVGFGAAGACAALEAAAANCDVVVLDRFTGGGATALSGGVVYAGGGTRWQREAGVADSADAMFAYLSTEVGDAVSPGTLREFCAGSPEMLAWLERHGVPFHSSLCPDKTSYPSNRHYLYYSGSELSAHATAPPAPRGHRVHGRGTSGKVLYAHLARAVAASGARVVPQTTACELITGQAGRVTGVACRTLRGAPVWVRAAHRVLHRWSAKPWVYAPKLGRLLHRPVAALEGRHGRPLRVTARRGVVLAAGGFVANRPMLLTGLLVDRAGQRLCDESRYGAAIGDAVMTKGKGQAWLLADRATVALARRQLRGPALWFQRFQGWYLLTAARVSAPTVAGVAAQAGIDPAGLAATVQAYNAAAAEGNADPAGKPAELVRAQDQPPFSLIDCSVRPRLAYPAPMLTLGGLVVAEGTGQVCRADGTPVPGLYAAGRTAVGLCSHSYVSGLSLADCVFSGRRAGRHAAAAEATVSAATSAPPPARAFMIQENFRPPGGEKPPRS